jgi:nicotinamide riboside kinase
MTKIIFTGPESSGKTTIAQLAATHYNTNWVAEYARTYLGTLNRPYQTKDLLKIATGQVQLEQKAMKDIAADSFLFVDTSILVIKVWSIYKYGYFNFQLEKLLRKNLPKCYFLCDWQIPWEYDPLRENPTDRAILYQLYKQELENLTVPYFELTGNKEERLARVISVLKNFKG